MGCFQPARHHEYDEAKLFSLSARHKIVDITLDSTPVWVDTPESFDSMIAKIIKSKEIAIDLEFDSSHLFHDCTALFQISIPYNHFVLDPFITFSIIRDKLGPILMNPNIVKLVFSDNDLQALQRAIMC
jgi:exosome complex exonuclease RRP6